MSIKAKNSVGIFIFVFFSRQSLLNLTRKSLATGLSFWTTPPRNYDFYECAIVCFILQDNNNTINIIFTRRARVNEASVHLRDGSAYFVERKKTLLHANALLVYTLYSNVLFDFLLVQSLESQNTLVLHRRIAQISTNRQTIS